MNVSVAEIADLVGGVVAGGGTVRITGFGGLREARSGDLAFLADVPLRLNIVLGEVTMPLGEVIALETDSIVQLDKLSGEPIDIYVENQKLGKGEVIVLHEKLRVRLVEVTSPSREREEPETQGTKG